MNRLYGLSASKTLELAQSLYENKLLTYPRTDSQYLSQDMKGKVVSVLRKLKTEKQFAKKISNNCYRRIRSNYTWEKSLKKYKN